MKKINTTHFVVNALNKRRLFSAKLRFRVISGPMRSGPSDIFYDGTEDVVSRDLEDFEGSSQVFQSLGRSDCRSIAKESLDA